MSQNKSQYFFKKIERACTTYHAPLRQLCAQPLHDFDRALILFQPAYGSKVIEILNLCFP